MVTRLLALPGLPGRTPPTRSAWRCVRPRRTLLCRIDRATRAAAARTLQYKRGRSY